LGHTPMRVRSPPRAL